MKRKATSQATKTFSGKKPRLMRQGAAYGSSLSKKSSLLSPELKFNDVSANADATTTATITNLNTMASGDTALLRDGNKILSKSVQIRGTVRNESATISTVFRILVVHDKNSNGTAPTAAQIFEGTPTVYALKSIANSSRFTTLLDKTYVNNSNGSFNYLYINEYVKVPMSCQLASFADGTAAVPISGSLTMVYIGSEAAGIADTDCLFAARCRFQG